MDAILERYAAASVAALGFFWKAGWAFVMGYAISAMIQAFVPRARLTERLGAANPRSLALSTLFGAASSSCSFAALAAARALFAKGAHFILVVAFMFASTNLVIELGILIFIFLGWEYLVAELIGGMLLIAISAVLIRLTAPEGWIERAREQAREIDSGEREDFDWRERIASRAGWRLVGHTFVMDWRMVWKEIVIGFTIAGYVATLVPADAWTTVFLVDADAPAWLIALENALVAPLVAAATFIGSMGNIPLATVLASSGVLFAGVMAFIYSDLMVPPLVAVNARYYGWRAALYIAAVMYVSAVVVALLLTAAFTALDALPEQVQPIGAMSRFAIDYTFWLNLGFVAIAFALWRGHRGHVREHGHGGHAMEGDGPVKTVAAYLAVATVLGGAGAWFLVGA